VTGQRIRQACRAGRVDNGNGAHSNGILYRCGPDRHYNEAPGSTCQYSVYDRVKGRTGDVPDETVGAHEESAEH
jgi:hypothetical protein